MRTVLIGLTTVSLLTLAGCSSGSTTTETAAPAASSAAAVAESAPASSAPAEESAAPSPSAVATPSEESTPSEEPTPEETESDVMFGDMTCAELEDEAVRISEDQDTQLLKVRALKKYKDNRKTLKLPKGDKEALVFSCKGTGVWSDTSRSPVLIKLVIDADGDAFVGYQEL